MRTALFTFIVIFLASCGNHKKENAISENKSDIVGKWQPTKIDLKGIPAILKDQINEKEIEESLLKSGWFELKEDSMFVSEKSQNSENKTLKWSFDGKTIKIISPKTEGRDTMDLAFYVEGLDKSTLEIDVASMYKAMMNMENMNIPIIDNLKIIMICKKVD